MLTRRGSNRPRPPPGPTVWPSAPQNPTTQHVVPHRPIPFSAHKRTALRHSRCKPCAHLRIMHCRQGGAPMVKESSNTVLSTRATHHEQAQEGVPLRHVFPGVPVVRQVVNLHQGISSTFRLMRSHGVTRPRRRKCLKRVLLRTWPNVCNRAVADDGGRRRSAAVVRTGPRAANLVGGIRASRRECW